MLFLYSRQPGEARETELNLTIGEYETLEYGIFTSAPLENGMTYTFSLERAERDGFINNTTLGRHEDDREHTGGRFNLNFEFGDGIEATVGIAVDEYDDGAQGFVRIADLNPTTFAVTRNNNYFTNTADTAGFNAIERNQQWVKLSKEFDWGTLEIHHFPARLGGFPEHPGSRLWSYLLTSPFPMVGTVIQSQETWTQEFRVEKDSDGLCPGRGTLLFEH